VLEILTYDRLPLHKFDAIVCDWKRPEMNGIQSYEHLTANDPVMARRVLFMSGDVINKSFQESLPRNTRRCHSSRSQWTNSRIRS
jgi:DNA-binding NarL/FixJ family response regulator